MEVPDGRFDTRKVIDVFGVGYLIACIEVLPSVLTVEDDSICVFILDIFN